MLISCTNCNRTGRVKPYDGYAGTVPCEICKGSGKLDDSFLPGNQASSSSSSSSSSSDTAVGASASCTTCRGTDYNKRNGEECPSCSYVWDDD